MTHKELKRTKIPGQERRYQYYLHRKGLNPNYHVHKVPQGDKVLRRRWRAIRFKCKKYGIPFNLDPDDIIVPEFCPALGIPLVSNVGHPKADSPSVDRIDPTLGYVKGNVVVVSFKANTMKHNGSWQDLRKLADYYEGLSLPTPE